MPARARRGATRNTAASGSHKASKATTEAQGPDASTLSHVEEAAATALRSKIASVFRDAQKTTATHRKLAVTLRKMHESCSLEGKAQSKAGRAPEEWTEEAFNAEFSRCVLRVMAVKKSEAAGDRIIRFVGLFLRHTSDKDNALLGETEADQSTMAETASTRLTSHVMEAILPLLMAKDKFVRYRSTQLIAHVINSLDAVDDELFHKLRHGLLKRIRDKEAMVRAQAVLGLGRLAGRVDGSGSDSEGEEDGDKNMLEKLLDVLQNDPSADVRRSLLVNLPITPSTLPSLLERARDQDAATRRAVYSRLLPALGDFRHLSLNMREKLLRWGLRDRDENVRKAAGRLFRERWIEDCAAAEAEAEVEVDADADVTMNGEEGKAAAEAAKPNFEGLLELLERIDVVNSGVENGVALEAMKGFWEGRPDYREAVNLDDYFWETLTAESVFMARTFNDFCRSSTDRKFEALVEEKLPEVTKLAFYLERYLNVLLDAIRKINSAHDAANEGDDDEEDEEDEDTVEQEFIVEQLLHIILTLDYSDEVGRRKMFALLRQTLSIPELPDDVTKLTVDVLRDICASDAAGEKEFCSVVLEAVADVHDTIVDEEAAADADENENESFHSARSEVSSDDTPNRSGKRKEKQVSEQEARAKAIKEIMINMKCLHIVQCMLTNVEGTLHENDHLVSMLNNLVVPAVRSHEAPVRERGLVCLGLCSLLDRPLAEENLTLFMHFFSKGHAALQITALHILTDILNVHGAQLLSQNQALLKVYVRALRSASRNADVQGAATLAVSKLLLGRIVTEPDTAAELLKTLVVAYFDPATAANQTVRQALNYFLPVFAFSRPENQQLMRSVALDALHALYNVRVALEDDDVDVAEDMAALATIGACLVDWTDPRKCYQPDQPSAVVDADRKTVLHQGGDVHLDLAADIMDKLGGSWSREEKKVMAGLLGKVYVSPTASEAKLRAVYGQVSAAIEDNTVADATGRNALYKIHVSLGKIVNQLGDTGAGDDLDRTVEPGMMTASRSRSRSRHGSRSVSLAGQDRSDTIITMDSGASARAAAMSVPIKEEEESENGGDEDAVDGGPVSAASGQVSDNDDDDNDDVASTARPAEEGVADDGMTEDDE